MALSTQKPHPNLFVSSLPVGFHGWYLSFLSNRPPPSHPVSSLSLLFSSYPSSVDCLIHAPLSPLSPRLSITSSIPNMDDLIESSPMVPSVSRMTFTSPPHLSSHSTIKAAPLGPDKHPDAPQGVFLGGYHVDSPSSVPCNPSPRLLGKFSGFE
ncbi:hypothetical protein Nepgr_013333 [Nepenthes gracilis]|uniref:Uncharacterized protein n=1 Tax=Nepenthes gracilis TaxID=150966 RepID=A0AAD3SIY9_NEPGR|nr:hypothetical protein Nepgr_013333 [Nepenthes gracilis]